MPQPGAVPPSPPPTVAGPLTPRLLSRPNLAIRPLPPFPRSLDNTAITDVGAVALAAALEHNTAVTTIGCVAPQQPRALFSLPQIGAVPTSLLPTLRGR